MPSILRFFASNQAVPFAKESAHRIAPYASPMLPGLAGKEFRSTKIFAG